MVTIRTLVCGSICLISRVAASPSILGIRTSIRTRSGRRRELISTASRPSSASPTTSKASSRANIPRKPWRTRPWSSAMTIRTGWDLLPGCISLPMIDIPFRVGLLLQRHLRHHQRSVSRFAVDLEVAGEQGYPLAHAGEADLLPRIGPVRHAVRREPAPPVPDLEADLLVAALERDVRPIRSRVLAYVGQRFLGDPEERRLHDVRQPSSSQGLLVAHPKTLVAKPLHLQPERGRQPEVVEHRGAQIGDHVAGLLDGLPDQLQGLIEILLATGRVGGVIRREVLQVLGGGGSNLGEPVVDVVGHPAALLLLGRHELAHEVLQLVPVLGEFLVEPGVLQRARGLVGQAGEGLHGPALRQTMAAVDLEYADDPVAYP